MPRTLPRALAILALGAALGIVINLVSPDRIAWIRPSLPAADRVSLDKAKTAWQTGDTIFLDARTPTNYHLAHIPGSLNLNVEDFDAAFPAVRPRLAPEQPLILYCDGAHCDQSVRLLERLRSLGYTNAHILVNGLTVWKRDNQPLAKGANP